MPFAFPSHQGLILPIRRWFKGDLVALSIGAALPDIIEPMLWPFRTDGEELGQWIGHSLLGVVLFMPVGLFLTWLVRKLPNAWLERLGIADPEPNQKPRLVSSSASVAIGSLSHVVFDFISHANFVILLPWYRNDDFFPTWWTHTWTSVKVPIYVKPYPIAPHTIVWFILTILGAVLFVRHVKRMKSQTTTRS